MGVHGLPCRFAIRGKRLPAAARSIGEKAGFPESFATRIQTPGLHLFVAFSQQGRKFAGTQLAVKNRRAIFVDSGAGDDPEIGGHRWSDSLLSDRCRGC